MNRARVSGQVMLRPVRVALAVRPESIIDYERAVQMATSVWGGFANPIVPMATVEQGVFLSSAFDVDVIIPVGDSDAIREASEVDGFRWDNLLDSSPFERPSGRVGRHILGSDVFLAPIRRRNPNLPLAHMEWDRDGSLDLLNLAWFGIFASDALGTRLRERFLTVARKIELPTFEPWPELSGRVSPLGATALEVKVTNGFFDAGLVVVDPEKLSDVIAFWNLRAAGNKVKAWPRGEADVVEESLRTWLQGDGAEWTEFGKNKPELTIWCDGALPDDLVTFVHDVRPEVSLSQSTLAICPDGEGRCGQVTTRFGNYFDVEVESTDITYQVPMPVVDLLPNGHWHQRFGFVAAEVKPSSEWWLLAGKRATTPVLRSFAPALRPLPDPVSAFVRPIQEGIVAGVEVSGQSMRLPLIGSFALVKKLFGGVGVQATTSDSGRYMSRFIEVLGGAHADSVANQPAARAVLNSATRSSFGKSLQALEQQALASQGEWPESFQYRSSGVPYSRSVLRKLAGLEAIRVRLKVRCMNCGNDCGVTPEDLNHDIKCELCGDVRPLALMLMTHKPDWLFATASILRSERLNETYPVMATISCFAATEGAGPRLPHHVIGLRLEGEGLGCEVDVAFLLQNDTQPILVIGEAKGFKQELDANDFRNLRKVQTVARNAGIDCYVLIATTRSEISDSEVVELRALCEEGLEQVKSPSTGGYPVFPIVLTGRELSVHSWHDDHPARMAKYWNSIPELAVPLAPGPLSQSSSELISI